MSRKILCISILLIISFSVLSQEERSLFPEGYVTNPVMTPFGIIATNDFQSSIYLIRNGEVEELVSAPGAGRFLHFNREKTQIGFKLINPDDEMQVPAILDLRTNEIIMLEEPHRRAGQVSFADDGAVAYVIDTRLIVRREGGIETYGLGVFSNLSPISPDGRKVSYKDYADQIWILNLQTGERYQITDPEKGYRGALWSPKSDRLVYSTIGTELYYYDLMNRQTGFIGEGENPDWSTASDQLVYHRREIDFLNIELLSSDLFIYDFDSATTRQLTDTKDLYEMDARFSVSNKEIIYHTYDEREIRFLQLHERDEEFGLFKEAPPIKLDLPLIAQEYQLGKAAAQDTIIAGNIDWVHIHQVYDTRNDWDQGRVCCGATTVAQVFATYNIFTPWPFHTYGHTSEYGLYISNPYIFNDITYTGYTGRWPSGGHGYLWHGGGSPRSRTVRYVLDHGISETWRDDNVSWNTVTTELDLGYSYILCSTGLTSGHIVLAIGTYGNQNTVVVNDPYGNKNAGSYGWVYNGKHALYDWADANTGRQKVTPIAWGVRVRFDPEEEPVVISYSPSTEDSVYATSKIDVTFSQPMERETLLHGMRLVPEASGTLNWSNSNRTVTFEPAAVLSGATTYTVIIDTSAKNIFGKNLSEPFEFEFITKGRDRLIVEKAYPMDKQTDISTTVQFRIWFDYKLYRIGLLNYFSLYDSNNEQVSLANVAVRDIDDRSFLSFEPKYGLDYNQEYHLFLYDGLRDIRGHPLNDTLHISFRTTMEKPIGGTIIDDFPDCNPWSLLGNDEGSSNVDVSNTSFVSTTERKISGTAAAKLMYAFEADEGLVMVSNRSAIRIDPAGTENFGIWAFGDLSGNLIEFHFLKDESEDVFIVVDSLNYTGWKLVTLDLRDMGPSDILDFSGVAIRKLPDGQAQGEIFFDQLQTNIVTPVRDHDGHIALTDFRLYQNYPNPFNPSTHIRYDIPHESHVRLTVYNMLGQQVAALVNEEHKPGTYDITLNVSHLPSGLYIYRLHAGDFIETKSFLFLK
jgi:hypothetical protein